MTLRGKARTFDDDELEVLLNHVTALQDSKSQKAQPSEVIRAAFCLSFYAGLRVQEIAGLRWPINVFQAEGQFRSAPNIVYDMHGNAVRDVNGEVQMAPMEVLYIDASIGKYGKPRNIPIHPKLKTSLLALYAIRDDFEYEGFWVIPPGKTGASSAIKHRAHALKMRINRLYKQLGIEQGSSHSGRRSFITRAARTANRYGASLTDVRDLAGHVSINTTQHYVDPSQQQGALVSGVWK